MDRSLAGDMPGRPMAVIIKEDFLFLLKSYNAIYYYIKWVMILDVLSTSTTKIYQIGAMKKFTGILLIIQHKKRKIEV